MKFTTLLLSIFVSTSVFAQEIAPVKYANPKTLNMHCVLATIYGNTNDSWSVTIKGLDVAFWDNSEWSRGKYTGVGLDNTMMGGSDRSYGNGRYFIYEGSKKDHWKITLGPTYFLENNKVDKRVPHVYGILKVPGKMKEQLLECRSISLKEAKDTFENAFEDHL